MLFNSAIASGDAFPLTLAAWLAVKIVGLGVEDDGASPNGFEVLNDERVGEEAFGLRSYRNLNCADSRAFAAGSLVLNIIQMSRGGIAWSASSSGRRRHALQRVKVVGQRIDEFAHSKLLEQTHGQQLAQQSSCTGNTDIPWVHLSFLLELQAVCNKCAKGRTVEVVGANLRLDGLHQKLADLWAS